MNGAVDKANLDITVDLTEVDPADFEWDFTTDYTPTTTGPTIFPRPAPQSVIDWYAEPYILRDESGASRRPAILMAWDGDMNGVVGVQYEVRLASDESHVTRGRTDQLAVGSIVVSHSLLPITDYEVRGQYIPSSPREMEWSGWLSVTTPDVRFGLTDFDSAVSAQVTQIIDSRFQESNKQIARLGRLLQQAISRTAIDKTLLRDVISVRSDNALAEIEEVRTVAVSADEAVAALSTSVTAELDDLSASVSESAIAIATLDGYAAAAWAIKVDVNGNFVGLELVNGGDDSSTFIVTADTFQVALPSDPSGTAVPVFTIGNVGGVPKLAFRGDMIIDGAISTQKIAAGAITANKIAAGAITATEIAAGAINTTQLAVNSVDITKLIAGAATKVDFSATVSTAGATSVLGSRVVDIQSGSAKITWVANFNVVGNPSATNHTIGFYVDGVLAKSFAWTALFDGATYSLVNPISVTHTATGLSAGNHTFEVRNTSFNPVGAGQMFIEDFRR